MSALPTRTTAHSVDEFMNHRAVPGSTCCRSAGPTAGCYRGFWRRIREPYIRVPEFFGFPGFPGKLMSALPTRGRLSLHSVAAAGSIDESAVPDGRNAYGVCPGFSDREESGGSNLWPTDSCGLGGSRWGRALPGGRQIRLALAAASGSGHCPVADRFVWPWRQPVGPGTARWPTDSFGLGGSQWVRALPGYLSFLIRSSASESTSSWPESTCSLTQVFRCSCRIK